ncbi:MAG: ribonuclease P protein component [Coriobacteriales bacterium]
MKGTIKAKTDVERLFRDGRRSTSYLLTLLVRQTDDPGRCAFIAGKKLGVAPLRSRCKRVMREVARELGGPWDGFDVVFVAKRKVAHAPHDKVVRQTRRQLMESGVIDGN